MPLSFDNFVILKNWGLAKGFAVGSGKTMARASYVAPMPFRKLLTLDLIMPFSCSVIRR